MEEELRSELRRLHEKYEASTSLSSPIGLELDNLQTSYLKEENKFKKEKIQKRFIKLKEDWNRQNSITSVIGKQLDCVNRELALFLKQKHGENPVYEVKAEQFYNVYYFSNRKLAFKFLETRQKQEPQYCWSLDIIDPKNLADTYWVTMDSILE